jgi:hypothetical protein
MGSAGPAGQLARAAGPWQRHDREDFDDCGDFVAFQRYKITTIMKRVR